MTDPIPERRRGDAMLLKHVDERFDKLEKLLKSGFPNGDPVEHCKVHERYIKEAEERAEVRLAVKKSVFSSGIWLGLLTALIAIGSYFGLEIKR